MIPMTINDIFSGIFHHFPSVTLYLLAAAALFA